MKKLVIAYIRQQCLEPVCRKLQEAGIDQGSANPDALGFGHEKARPMTFRGAVVHSISRPRARLELAVEEPMVDRAVEAICAGAWTGAVGDGRIFVLPMEEHVNIRTRERTVAEVSYGRT